MKMAKFIYWIVTAATADGKTLWAFNTTRDFETVNEISANRGSMGAVGQVVEDGILLVTSGYIGVKMALSVMSCWFLPANEIVIKSIAIHSLQMGGTIYFQMLIYDTGRS